MKPRPDLTQRNLTLPVVHYPQELSSISTDAELYGFYHPATNHYNILAWKGITETGQLATELALEHLGTVWTAITSSALSDGEWLKAHAPEGQQGNPVPKLVGRRVESNRLDLWQGEARYSCLGEPYQLYADLFSRNSGILETRVLQSTRVVLSGCGSVGSLMALELARAGVGAFCLIDADIVAYHNLCRHQCGIRDVGRFKVDAVRDRIVDINPTVRVIAASQIVEQVPKTLFDDFVTKDTIFIGCADNREADIRANEIARHYSCPFLSIGLWERGSVGEIFYDLPGETPCYACLFGGGAPDAKISNRAAANHRFYSDEVELERQDFEPGISADISYVTIVGVKLALDILLREQPAFEPRVAGYLSQFTLICNTNNIAQGGEAVEIFAHPLQVTHSLEVDFRAGCRVCGGKPVT